MMIFGLIAWWLGATVGTLTLLFLIKLATDVVVARLARDTGIRLDDDEVWALRFAQGVLRRLRGKR